MFYLLVKVSFTYRSPPSKLTIAKKSVLSDFHPMANDDYVT